MEHEQIEIEERQLHVLATQLGIIFPNYDPEYEQEAYPTTDPGPQVLQIKKNLAELI